MLTENEICGTSSGTSLSCYILTLNSEERLREVLASIDGLVDDLVVLDSGSSDQTETIARESGARFLYRKFDNFTLQKNYAAEQCMYDWVLDLDSDEVVSEALYRRIAQLKANNFNGGETDAFGIRREWYVLGKKVHCFYPSRCPDHVIRLFRKDRVSYSSDYRVNSCVHITASGFIKAEALDESIYHYTCGSIDHLYSKVNLYSTLAAQDLLWRGVTPSLFKVIVFPWLIWLQWYALYGGWKDGMVGLILGRYARDNVYQKFLKARYDKPLLFPSPSDKGTA